VIYIIAGTLHEAALHAAIRGYPAEGWKLATDFNLTFAFNVTRIDLVGSYRVLEDWDGLRKKAEQRMRMTATASSPT
jgi:hypothetical protein